MLPWIAVRHGRGTAKGEASVGSFHVLRYWRFTCVWSGLTLSSVGDSVTRLALIWLAYHLRASALDVGLLVTVYSAPIVIGGPLAGVALDRVGPRPPWWGTILCAARSSA